MAINTVIHRTRENEDLEKEHVIHEELRRGALSQDDQDFLDSFPAARKKKLLRKIDWRLMPMLVLLYLLAYLDKVNFGNAKIEGLLPDLHLEGIQYNVATGIYFITFVLCEIPSNMVLTKFRRPSIYIAVIVLIWGTIMTLNGVVQNYAGLLVVRFLLGAFEAGFFPGAILIISNWYLPNETQTRIALLYTSAATGGAFSGLLAFAISKMAGVGGIAAWQWIFILEGLFTIVVGIMCFFLLCDTPALSTRWLDADEIRYLETRQRARRVTSPREFRESSTHFDLKLFKDVFADWKFYILVVANWSNTVPNYAMKFAMPSILTSMGYTSSNAQLLTIPPYALGALSAFFFAYFADRTTWRFPFLAAPQTCLVVAFIILICKSGDIDNNVALCYFSVCLATFGVYPILPGVSAWQIVNTPDPTKRAINIAALVCVGNLGGLVGSYIYIDSESPRYPTGYGTSLAFAVTGLMASITLEFYLKRENKKKALLSEAEIRAKYTDEELELMGERSPLFKYSL